ncbi:MFS transporter [Nitrobacter sp. 62-13]|uniref:MFS transporter n=1 Tax=Nitrobacter sp. 62-13 TaxID=1895797 RepID=UPI000AFE5C3D|nr:MFS transporter [Nitrobacter sp. 62-13]
MADSPYSSETGSSPSPQEQSHSNLLLLYVARGVRGLGDGFTVILLPAYLSAIGLSPAQIGIIATASLLGTAALTLGIGWIAPRHDLRSLLLIGAFLMTCTGLAFATIEYFPFIVIAAFVGTINPSSSDIGMLVPLEHAMLARGASDRDRTSAFARYSLVGALSMAAGSLAAAIPDLMVSFGFERLNAFALMFYLYACLAVVATALYRHLPRSHTEVAKTQPPLGPSRAIVFKLAALFSIDAFAGGFVVQSLMALWLFVRFDLSLTQASLFFFLSSLLSAFSYPIAARLAQRFGLVNTMVFTHIPSSLCLIAAAIAPDLTAVLILLLVRSALSQMDVPTRTSYVMAVVTPEEQPTAASVTAVPRTLAASVSPIFSGALLATAFPGLPLIICGTLKVGYDLALLYSFRHIKPPEENSRSVH